MTSRNNRWRAFADAQIQGTFCVRIIIYWLVCQFAMGATILGMAGLEGARLTTGGSVFRFVIPAIFFSLFMLPIALLDAIYFTNRIAGPLFSFRRTLRQLVTTGEAEPVRFREHDYFSDLATNFNLFRDQLGQHQAQDRDARQLEFDADCEAAVMG